MTLIERCQVIEDLFEKMDDGCTGLYKEGMVTRFRECYPNLNFDLDFCFEILAGKHKLGYTFDSRFCENNNTDWMDTYKNLSLYDFYYQQLKTSSLREIDILNIYFKVPEILAEFFEKLCNREYRLGYSNKKAMRDGYTPMLAKKYPDDFHLVSGHDGKEFFIQEKLDGNRCIAYFDRNEEKWHFRSRSGKEKDLPIDMDGMNEEFIYDGEVMTYGKAGTRDFNATSGVINSKYMDKSSLHYYVYDILDTEAIASSRRKWLENQEPTGNVTILKTERVTLYPNLEYNHEVDEWLDKIVSKGGEGVILRDPTAYYKQERTAALLKYKQVQTMDMEVIGIEEGTGKYEGMVGSLHCRCVDGDRSYECWVGSGLSDYDRLNWKPEDIIGRIVEVAYFSISESKENKNSNRFSLRFPRLKRVRYDKTETSVY